MREFQDTFGDFLLKKRKERDMTIKDITKRLKISEVYFFTSNPAPGKRPAARPGTGSRTSSG